MLADVNNVRLWSPRDVRRWGDRVQLTIPAGALDLVTAQLVYAQAPSPCVWRVCASVSGFVAGDAATFRFELDVGCGNAMVRTESDTFAIAGTGVPVVIEMPAQTIAGRLRLQAAAVGAIRDVTAALWVAPTVPFDGLCVGVNCE